MKLKSRPEKVSVQGSWVWGVRGRMAPGVQQSELPEPWGHSSTPGSPFLHPKKKKDKNPYLYNRRIRQVCFFIIRCVMHVVVKIKIVMNIQQSEWSKLQF